MATRQLGASLLSGFDSARPARWQQRPGRRFRRELRIGRRPGNRGRHSDRRRGDSGCAASPAAANGIRSAGAASAVDKSVQRLLLLLLDRRRSQHGQRDQRSNHVGGGTLASALAGVFGQGASLFGNLFSSLFGGAAGGTSAVVVSWLQLGMSAASVLEVASPMAGVSAGDSGTGTSDSIPILASNDELMTLRRRYGSPAHSRF